MKIYKDLTHHWSPDYLLRDDNGKLLLKASKSECEEEMKAIKLNNKIAKEFSLPVNDNSSKLVSDYDFTEFDKWMDELIEKNGTTEY